MLGDILRFLFDIGFTLFGAALVLRAWIQVARVHPFHPIPQAISRVTNWLVLPLRRIIPGYGGIDWASLVGAWLTAIVYLLVMALLAGAGDQVLSWFPAVLGIAVLTVLKWTLNLIVWVTLIQAILSWINPQAPAMSLLYTLTAPLLNPVRRVIPLVGGLDLSPLVVLIAAQVGLMVVERLSFSLFGL